MGFATVQPGEILEVTLLGQMSLRYRDRVINDDQNRSYKLWSILAYLLVHRDREVAQSEFIELIWADDDEGNPVGALKTLLFRLRKLLIPLFGEELQPIISRRGAYAWNPQIPCRLDCEEFERLCRKAKATEDGEDCLVLLREILTLYTADFLPKLGEQLWTVMLSTHYHTLYLEAVKRCSDLLEKSGQYEEMERVCDKAIQLDAFDESLYVYLIRALLKQKKNAQALTRYEAATDSLYRTLGVQPSEALRALYKEIMRMQQSVETDLDSIVLGLGEEERHGGAFYCEYGFFQEAYRLTARQASRDGVCIHIGLLTLTGAPNTTLSLEQMSRAMSKLCDLIIKKLRRGDVVSRYSGAQYLVLLPRANFEDSITVMNRIVSAYNELRCSKTARLAYKLQEMELEYVL